MELLSHSPDFNGLLDDKRLERRAQLLSTSLVSGKSSSVHAVSRSEAEQKGFYRFLGNERVTEGQLITELSRRCFINSEGRDILVIQDSSSIGLSKHSNRIEADSGVGLVGNKVGLGFLSHTSLVLDANRETILGIADLQLWHRTEDKANNTTKVYKGQPIEEKESYKWIKASNRIKEELQNAKSITIVQDREGDIYDQFCLIADDKTNLIIRSRDNRRLASGDRLHQVLASSKKLGSYIIEVYGDLRKDKISRTATVEVRAVPVTIQKPRSAKSTNLPESLCLYAVEVIETTPGIKDPLCWRLLTTIKIETFEQAVAIINRYKQRWYIEQLFRLLKKQGYRIEESQLGTGWAIRKLFVLLVGSAIRIMQLYLAHDREECQPTCEVFSSEEIECLESLEKKQIKTTEKTINPYPKEKLSWACWIIARLGGWKGNPKQRPPGPILLKEGLEKFEMIFQGWKLAKQLI
jgi:hypothetical protein